MHPDGYNCDLPVGQNNANNAQDTSNVVKNKDGSVLERLEYLQSLINGGTNFNMPNYLAVPIVFAAATTGSVAAHEILTVTGMVRLRIIPECTVNVAGNGTIELGVAGDTDIMIGTTTGTDIDAGEIWLDTSPTELAWNYSSIIDKVIPNGLDVGYEIKTDTLTAGEIIFHCWWEPLNSTGSVVAADGTGIL